MGLDQRFSKTVGTQERAQHESRNALEVIYLQKNELEQSALSRSKIFFFRKKIIFAYGSQIRFSYELQKAETETAMFKSSLSRKMK